MYGSIPFFYKVCGTEKESVTLEDLKDMDLEGTKSGVSMVWNADEKRQEVLNFLALFPPVIEEL